MVIAKKSLGQNFLHDHGVLNDILKASEVQASDRVLEIGPGEGFLTRALLEKAAHLTCIELDNDLIPWLKIDFGKNPKFELVHANVLHYAPTAEPYKLIANIPYYITSPILNHFLLEQFQNGNPPTRIVLMVQKEVAEKIIAKDGKHSVLSLQVHLFGEPSLVRIVSPKAFRPSPKVESAVIRIDVASRPKIEGDLKKLFWLFHAGFTQKRKKLTNNLGAALRKEPAEVRQILKDLGINEDIRAEDLTLNEWAKLSNALHSLLPSF